MESRSGAIKQGQSVPPRRVCSCVGWPHHLIKSRDRKSIDGRDHPRPSLTGRITPNAIHRLVRVGPTATSPSAPQSQPPKAQRWNAADNLRHFYPKWVAIGGHVQLPFDALRDCVMAINFQFSPARNTRLTSPLLTTTLESRPWKTLTISPECCDSPRRKQAKRPLAPG